MTKRVVITGLGAITALGEGAVPLWQAVLEGRSAIDFVDFESGSEKWKSIGALIRDFVPEKFVTQRKALKVMARDIQLAVAGASLAMEDAGTKNLGYDPERFGVIVGSGVLNHELDELSYSVQNSLNQEGGLDLNRFGYDGLSALFPLWLLKYLPNMPACHISILFDLRGMNNTLTTGPSAGLQAVGEAFRIIQRGDADLMLAGGAESKLNPVGLSQYKILGVLSDSEKDPKKNYRPFDASSNGLVVGEGAGFLVLEELEHAKKRGAKIYAEITGFGSSYARGHRIAMQAAMKEAQLTVKEISYMQASGIGIAAEDRLEAQAIHELFNGAGRQLHVSASKPITGFTGFSSGALDLILSTLALKNQTIPAVMNFNRTEKEWGFEIVKGSAVSKKFEYAMTNSSGFNGQTVSVITKSCGENR